jgi:hypothetical protein
MSKPYRELHDLLLEGKPEGADHDKGKCPICTGEIETASQEENVADEAIFTTEQHEQLLSAAVENAKAEATADADAEVLRLNEQLKQAEGKAEAAETQVTELESKISDRDEAERLAALADERAELVKAAVNFSDEQIEARKESWATKDDEEFEALVEDYKAAADAATEKSEDDGKTPESKFDGTRQTAGEDTGPESVKKFFDTGLAAV